MKPFVAATLSVFCFALPVHAQDEAVCMKTAEMEAALVDWYNETPAQQQEDGSIIWASAIGGTWTLVSYEPDGLSCTLAQGDNWSPHMDGEALIARLEQANG